MAGAAVAGWSWDIHWRTVYQCKGKNRPLKLWKENRSDHDARKIVEWYKKNIVYELL